MSLLPCTAPIPTSDPASAEPNVRQRSISQRRSDARLTVPQPRLVSQRHPQRAQTEAFIRQRYWDCFQARLEHFMPTLVRIENPDGSLAAALGLRDASSSRLFVEDYLDLPAEQALAQALNRPVSRERLVEVGNLAVGAAISGRQIVAGMTCLLTELGYRQVIFAATRQLRASLERLGLQAIELSSADPCRLGTAADRWGDYYQTQPKVLCGALAPGLAHLQRQGLL